jgi:hypothetical protein
VTDASTTRPGRREPSAREERLDVLRMLEGGTITADEAARLLDALDRTDRAPSPVFPPTSEGPNGGRPRHVRVRISEGGKIKVNLRLPLGLLDAGIGIARRFAPDRIGDAQLLRDAILSGMKGELVDIDDNGERVEIIVE